MTYVQMDVHAGENGLLQTLYMSCVFLQSSNLVSNYCLLDSLLWVPEVLISTRLFLSVHPLCRSDPRIRGMTFLHQNSHRICSKCKTKKIKKNNRTVHFVGLHVILLKLLSSHVATLYRKSSGLNRHKLGDEQQFRENRTGGSIVVSFSDFFF